MGGLDSTAYRKARAAALDPAQGGSTICYLCLHDGADQVDHIKPRSTHPYIDEADPTNLLPVHGVRRCPVCGECCNQVKGNRELIPPRRSRDW